MIGIVADAVAADTAAADITPFVEQVK